MTDGWEIMCSTSFRGDPGTGEGGCLSLGRVKGVGEMAVATRGRGRGVWAAGGRGAGGGRNCSI